MLVSEVLALADQRHGDPAAAIRSCDALIDDASTDSLVRSLALWVRGLARHELDEPRAATKDFRKSIVLATTYGHLEAEARARANLAISLQQLGAAKPAATQITRALESAPAQAIGFVTYLGGLHEQRCGRHETALARYAAAEPELTRVGDQASLAGLHLNRGVLFVYRGDFVRGHADFAISERVAQARGLTILMAMAAHNLGFAAGRLGHVADGLRALDRARTGYQASGSRPRQLPVLLSDRAEILLTAGLAGDARHAAEDAVRLLSEGSNISDLSEARLLLARACLDVHDFDEARAQAAQAARAFRTCRRPAWTALALYVGLEADFRTETAGGPIDSRLLERCRRVARQLLDNGWPVESRDARIWAARVAARRGHLDTAEAELAAAGALMVGGVVEGVAVGGARGRASLWLARAETLVGRGQTATAGRAIRRGLRDLDGFRARIGGTEAVVEGNRLAKDLAQLGTDLAVSAGRPLAALQWSDRLRGVSSVLRVAPPEDGELIRQLESWRQLMLTTPSPSRPTEPPVESLGGPGGLASPGGPVGLGGLVGPASPGGLGGPGGPGGSVGLGGLEEAIRDQALLSDPRAHLAPAVSWVQLNRELGDAVLVGFAESAGGLHAVTVTRKRSRIVSLGPVLAARHALDYLTVALGRLAFVGPARVGWAMSAVDQAVAELDALLLAPLRLPLGPIVVVPTGALHQTPWAMLPSLRTRDAVVAPSVGSWIMVHRSSAAPAKTPRVLIVAGPDLPAAEAETAMLRALYPSATCLTGVDATVARVLAETERADLVHVAAHGSCRADSPMFSNLRLADGPLSLFDLQRIRQVPRMVVLSACSAASSYVGPGDSILGTASAWAAIGVRTVVASVVPVPDEATARLMGLFHRGLLDGFSATQALRVAAAELRVEGPSATLAASAFMVIGADSQ